MPIWLDRAICMVLFPVMIAAAVVLEIVDWAIFAVAVVVMLFWRELLGVAVGVLIGVMWL